MQELDLIVSHHAQEISDYLFELGALAVTLRDAQDNPIFEPPPETLPLWPSIKLSALFADEVKLEDILLQLYAVFDPATLQLPTALMVEQRDWVRETQRQFQPMCFGDRLWIYPSWEPAPDNAQVKILLDPGLAFGTGTHPTTGLILRWLDQHPPQDKTIIDYGCGSGILALAAAKLGAKHVICTDIDPQALLATEENAQRNSLDPSQFSTCLPEKLMEDVGVDLILANILAEPLQQLAAYFYAHTVKNGYVVLSGILATQHDAICTAYQPYFALESVYQEQEWLCMVWQHH